MAKTNCVATRLHGQVRASRLLRSALRSAILLLVLFSPAFAHAMSVKDYMALPIHDQSVYSGNFIEKMTADIGRTNPKLMQDIRDWFAKTDEGAHNLSIELLALESLAKKGKADLSKIQIEGVIVKIVKDKFPPQRKD